MRIFGIQIKATDQASQTFSNVGRGLASMRTAASSAAASLGSVGVAMVVANQGLELVKKGVEALRAGYEAFVAPALEARSALDPGKASIDQLVTSANALRTSIGDALIPVLGGIGAALSPVIARATEWVTANRQVIATRMAEWARDLGLALESVLTPGLQLAATAVAGLRMTWVVLRDAAGQAVATILRGYSSIYDGVARVAEAVGADEMAASMRSTAAVTRSWGADMEASSQGAAAEVIRLQAELSEARGRIGSIGASAREVLEQIVPAASRIAGESIRRVSVEAASMMDEAVRMAAPFLAERRAEEAAFQRNQQEAASALAAANLKEIQKIEDAKRVASEKQKQADEKAAAETLRQYQSVGDTVSGVVMSTIAVARQAIGAGAEAGTVALRILEQIGQSVLDILTQMLVKFVVFSALKAILNVATGGATAAIPMPGFASGGMIPLTAGTPGRDSVPILAQPGESVLTVEQTRALRANLSGQGPPIRRGGGTPTVNVYAGSFVPSSRADLERTTRDPMTRILAAQRMTGARS